MLSLSPLPLGGPGGSRLSFSEIEAGVWVRFRPGSLGNFDYLFYLYDHPAGDKEVGGGEGQ